MSGKFSRLVPLVFTLLCLLVADPSAWAVIVASGDGTENTSAPADDPGWANVGVRGGLTAIYLGNGWVVTASHVGVGAVTFGGVTHSASPSPGFGFQTAPGQFADLLVFKLKSDPPLPALVIASAPPAPGAQVVMIGNGVNRGAPISWIGINGWLWGAGNTMRWGTNQVSAAPQVFTLGTTVSSAFCTDFTQSPPQVTPYEAQTAVGDSGGAVFFKNGSTWELAGVLFAIDSFVGQPANSALYGNQTFAIDLSFYRSAILDITTKPACSDGIDDDGDGFADFPADPGCSSATSTTESPACQDGIDNDGDGGIDFDGGKSANHGVALGPADVNCIGTPSRNTESAVEPEKSLGAGLAFAVPLLMALRARRARQRRD